MLNTFQVRLFDELDPCYPDTPVNEGHETYRVACANGTYAGVNLLMSGITPGIPVTITVHGDHTGYKLFNMIPVPVEVNTGAKQRSEYLKNDYNENVIRRAPFMVYEALEPIYNILMPTMTTCGINFKAIVEYCREVSQQHWVFMIAHGDAFITLEFTVDTYPVTVPKAGKDTHQYVNWFSFDNIAHYHGLKKWSPAYWQMLEKYLLVAVYSRQNMLTLPLDACFTIENGSIHFDEEILANIVSIAKKVGIAYFQGGAFTSRYEGVRDDDDFYTALDHDTFTHTDQVAAAFKEQAFDLFDNGTNARTLTGKIIPSKDGEDDLRQMARLTYAFIHKNHLEDVYTQCALDEPNDALANTYAIITNIIREEMPGIPIFEPVMPTEAVVGSLDIWCPCVDVYENNQAFYHKQVAQGDDLFVYTCLTPGGNYANRLLDLERLRIVWLGWAPAKYTHIKGFLHWGANQYLNINPFKRQAVMFSEQVLEFHPKRANFLPAGDFCIFYPGYNEPLISIRSEAHRIGFEDLCLLEILGKKDEQKKDEIVASVFRGYGDYEKSVAKYREAKKLLLNYIMELNQ